ncbi:MAG: cytochrome c [Armatimonadota bacterium]|nr:cytochrome c [Armatimonadota bacterium]
MRVVGSLPYQRARGAAERAAPLVALVLAVLLAAVGCSRGSGPGPQAGTPQVRGDPERGEQLFGEKGCIGCHTVGGVGGQVGPNLTEVGRRDLARERPGRTWPDVSAYIRESIKDPQAYIVPGFPNPSPMPSAEVFFLSERDIDDLVAYLVSVSRTK